MGAIAVSAIIAGCGGGGHTAKPSSDASVGAPIARTSTATATAPLHVAPLPPAPPSPELVALRAALTSALGKGGPQTGAMVYDLTAKQPLFALRANVGRPPASVEKLYTTVATLRELGPNARLKTTVVGAGHLGPGGVWHGNLYLVGGGDPTFGDGGFNRNWEQGYGPTATELVSQLAHDGIKRVTRLGDRRRVAVRRAPRRSGHSTTPPTFRTSAASCPRSATTTARRSRSSTRARSRPRSSR